MDSQEYLIRCWYCSAEFDLISAPFCNHPNPSKICPFCLHCSCEAPGSYQDSLWENCPKQMLEEKMMRENRSNFMLGEILIGAGKITEEQLMQAMEKQRILKKRLGEILVMMDLVTPEELDLFLIQQKPIEKIDLSRQKLDILLIEKIGIDFCVVNKVVPLEELLLEEKRALRLAVSSDMEPSRLKLEERISDYLVIPYLVSPHQLEDVLKKLQREDDPDEVLILEGGDD